MVYPHQVDWKICLTTAGIELRTFGTLAQCSPNWATRSGRFKHLIFQNCVYIVTPCANIKTDILLIRLKSVYYIKHSLIICFVCFQIWRNIQEGGRIRGSLGYSEGFSASRLSWRKQRNKVLRVKRSKFSSFHSWFSISLKTGFFPVKWLSFYLMKYSSLTNQLNKSKPLICVCLFFRLKLRNFWSDETRLPNSTLERLVQILRAMYSPNTESQVFEPAELL